MEQDFTTRYRIISWLICGANSDSTCATICHRLSLVREWAVTEIDMFSGVLVRMGRELGIPMPYNEFAYHMINALEEKNDGLFDYEGRENERTCAR